MENKSNIVIELIKQDMRFHQYLSSLRNSGIDTSTFELDLMGIVAILMKAKGETLPDAWMELYAVELHKSQNFSIEALGNNLYPLAEECYYLLVTAV
jgi:hypothetical protein